MSFYVDTSVFIAWLTGEARSGEANAWLALQMPGEVAVSDWTVTEVSAALSRKVRSGRIPPDAKLGALGKFRAAIADTLIVQSVRREHFHQAARLADAYKLGLRSGDALHLAIAQLDRLRLVTFDKGQSDAAEALGIANHLL